MSKRVQKSKNSVNIGVAIFTAIVSIIPVIIVAFTGFSHLKSTYGVYALATFGICVYFSCIFAMFAWKNKILYIVLEAITVLGTLGFVIYAYCNASYRGGLLLHIATALLFTLSFYQTGDVDQGDGFVYRYIVPVVIDISGLVFVLWFIGVHMHPTAHIVIVSIINFFILSIFLIPSLVKMLRNREDFFDRLSDDEVEYEEETEEEIKAKKEEKRASATAKKQQLSSNKSNVSPNTKKTSGVTKWFPYDSQLDTIEKDIIHQYNKVIDIINDNIRDNNKQIKYSRASGTVRDADRSNKDIKKCLRYMKHQVKIMKKNLEKIRKKVFTTDDMYKSFRYSLLNGKLKGKKSSEDWPTLYIERCRVYYRFLTWSGYEYLVEIEIDGEDIYLKH